MILYNVTVKVDKNIHEEWLEWMKNIHIPDLMNTGLFLNSRICRLLHQEETEGITYAIQYTCKSMAEYEEYQDKHAPSLQAEHTERYKNRFIAFRTLMEILNNH